MPPLNIQSVLASQPALGILPRSFLLGPDFAQFATEFPGPIEVIRWPWYAYKAYPAAGSTQIILFNENMGNATNGIADTNLAIGGATSGGEAMIVRNVRVVPFADIADVAAASATSVQAFKDWYPVLTKNCWLEMLVLDKLYLRGAPLTLFPSGIGMMINAIGGGAGAINIAPVQNGWPSNTALYELDPPLYIPAVRALTVTLNWKALNTVTTAGRIGVILDGWRVRAVQ